MAKKTIKIRCSGSGTAKLEQFEPTQGNLKTLSKTSYEKLRRLIETQGFSFPVFVWRDKNTLRLLDGHQRIATLRKMRDEEGYGVPELPFAEVMAANLDEAKKKLLAVASQFGKVDRQGLYEFVHEADIDLAFLLEDIELPEIKLENWAKEFFEGAGGPTKEPEKKEAALGETRPMATCPECNHSFPIPK